MNTPLTDLHDALAKAYDRRITLVSPPRVGSTPVARLLWEHPAVTHHSHEPFEAFYWGTADVDSVERNFRSPMIVATGERAALPDGGGGLLAKEMSFQLDEDQFLFLARLATSPVLFVIRNPLLTTTSRLRIVHELYGRNTFEPWESGWDALARQVEICGCEGIPYVVLDSDDLRTDPVMVASTLLSALDLPQVPGLHRWRAQPGLQLCTPEVGALMSEKRTSDDPFYRRVLASVGVQPPDTPDWEAQQQLVTDAGLIEHVTRWNDVYGLLQSQRLQPEK
ncbi:hypothetical protein [Nocardia sp. SC052]|uniref:hypothetical protein n=1 Tax=Nocardia sichangensis TaxID=3385975 RepID=UPI0039A0883C